RRRRRKGWKASPRGDPLLQIAARSFRAEKGSRQVSNGFSARRKRGAVVNWTSPLRERGGFLPRAVLRAEKARGKLPNAILRAEKPRCQSFFGFSARRRNEILIPSPSPCGEAATLVLSWILSPRGRDFRRIRLSSSGNGRVACQIGTRLHREPCGFPAKK